MGRTIALCAHLDLLREFNEVLVRSLGDGVVGIAFGVFPLFGCAGVRGVFLTGLGLFSASESPTAANRDRFGEGGGRLSMATGQYSGGFLGLGRLDAQNFNPFRLGPRPFLREGLRL